MSQSLVEVGYVRTSNVTHASLPRCAVVEEGLSAGVEARRELKDPRAFLQGCREGLSLVFQLVCLYVEKGNI